MFKRLVILIAMSVALSGCYMVPMALIGPASSGFTTASILQSGVTATANYVVKKSTGKTISQHALDSISVDVVQQSYFPKKEVILEPNKIEK